MNTKQEDMTTLGAVGYILGVAWGFLLRYYRFFAIVFACVGLWLLTTGTGVTVTYLQPVNGFAFSLKLGDGGIMGALMLAGSAALWFSRGELKI